MTVSTKLSALADLLTAAITIDAEAFLFETAGEVAAELRRMASETEAPCGG